ncbi:MAG: endo alpha-1,4 polygalactosaminidase [Deltaproteobacteria bacterium]|nr:endo alpha-1,4 polygalactosaminidase [Deltaproteobacteria bacterium]
MRWPLAIICCATLAGCGGSGGDGPDASTSASDASTSASDASTSASDGSTSASDGATSSARGFPTGSPWVSFYGTAQQMGDLARVAATFRVINIDADPGAGNFTPAQITQLRAGGTNRVISYFNLGSCENYRSYWSSAPAGLRSCSANTAAQRGAYDGYPDEVWMNVGDADYQRLLLEHVAPRLVAQGIDGFFFDNLEIVEHGTSTTNGPCDAACAQGGLDLIRRLREKYPDLLFVMQNATGAFTRQGRTGGVAYPALLDGVSHEEVYAPSPDTDAEAELVAWGALGLRPGGRAFWIATEDYVGSCGASSAARAVYDKSRARGFQPYATDASGGQLTVCYWPF